MMQKPTDNTTAKLYVSDLDGTLLRKDGTLSDYSRRRLEEMLADGLHFTVASARSVVSIRQALGDLPLRLPVIEINGAFISDLTTGEHLVVNSMPLDAVETIYERVGNHDCAPFISTYNGTEDCLYHPEIRNDGIRAYYQDRLYWKDRRLRHTHDLRGAFRDQVVAFTVIGRCEEIAPLEKEINTELSDIVETHFFDNPYSPGWWWLTVHDRSACKSLAIAELIEMYGYEPANLTVFGDSVNDRTMFRRAARAVAVANADDDLKALADEIIDTNESNAVVDYIAAKNGFE